MKVVTVPYGAPARDALARIVAAIKADAGDPLAPVTVVVHANSVGVAARRALARRGGVIGVQMLTVYRLAELLGGARLAAAGRRPVSTPVLAAAVRAVLAERATIFAAVREHAATEEALIAAHRLLSDCSPEALDAVAARGRRASDVVRVHRAVRERLAQHWFDERDLIDTAIAAVADGAPQVAALGTVVVHLPQPLSLPPRALLHAVARRTEVVVIEGTTGSPSADEAVADTVTALSGRVPPVTRDGATSVATDVRSLSDADEEARAAVRDVVAALHDGVPIDRIAILHSTREPYARLLHEHCVAADLVVNGLAVRTLADSMVGRFLLRLLALPDSGFGRAEVGAWLAGAPVRDGRSIAPSARWEAVSRRAGVVRGDDWDVRLAAHAAAQQREGAEERAVRDREPNPGRFEREAATAEALRRFVGRVRARLAPRARSWSEHTEWAKQLVGDLLGHDAMRARWPEREQRAAAMIDAALDRLGSLDAIEPARPSRAVFRRTLELELATDLGRLGRQGVGVLVAPLSFGVGLDLDRLVIVGAAEGLLPARRHGDALLPDDDRVAAGGELRLVADAVHDDHRALLAAMASCRGRITLSWPRGDLRRTTQLRPSRFVLDTVSTLAGARLDATELERRTAPWYAVVASFRAGVTAAPIAATAQDHRLQRLATGAAVADPGGGCARSVDCMRSRTASAFTRFDGNVTRLATLVPGPARDARPISATSLQEWASNPFEYFVAKVLRAEIPEPPEERFEISALDRGNLVHRILEHWLRERLVAGDVPPPTTPWPAAHRDRLVVVAHEEFAAAQRQGLTGRRIFWDRDQASILRDLERFVDEDDRWRRARGATPCAAELDFGLAQRGPRPAVEMRLTDGRIVRLRGSADRVDVGADGTIHVVDYKTGKADGMLRISELDPDQRGTKLQLPVYALAARAALDRPDAPVQAHYWFITSAQGNRSVSLPLTATVHARIDHVITEIVDGIEAGVFPCRPGEDGFVRNRSHADPDALGVRDLARAWTRKCGDAQLARFCALAGEEHDVEPNGAVR